MSLNKKSVDANSIKHIDGLYGYAMILTRNQVEAEDLVQETYHRAIPAMSRLCSESNLKGWLFTILRNSWLNHVQNQQTGLPINAIGAEEYVSDVAIKASDRPHDVPASKMEIEQVRAAIEMLPIDFREIILLREYENLSYPEIAEILDCPLETVMSRLGRARSKLRQLLSARFQKLDTEH